jgi:hypothetical protein
MLGLRTESWETSMKHAHETYLERRLALIDLEIGEAQSQAVVSIAHVGELKRRRQHVVGELDILRERREASEVAYSRMDAFR